VAGPTRIVWVSFAPLERRAGKLSSSIASVRYRLLLPSAALYAQGCDSKVIPFMPGADRRTLREKFRGADAVVLGKLLAPAPHAEREAREALELAAQLRDARIAVLADFSDDHFADPVRGDAYRALANAVDAVVASTPELAEVLRQHTRVPVSVVTDPVEGARGEPRVPAASPFRLLWFGHPSNLDTLQHGLPHLQGQLPVEITLVTAPGAGAEALAVRISGRFRPWSTQAVFDELRQCDAVFIPSNPYDPRKAVKSPNRFTESTWAGRFVIAHPLPAYRELADFGWVGDDLGEGLRWLAGNADQALQRIRRGQALVAERFSPAAVGAAWKQAIAQAMQRP
jgi:glycosyltransferase involved in cell wall biosynthesis